MLLQAVAEVLFTLDQPALTEVSGIAAAGPDRWVVVNDSNEDLRFTTLDGSGRPTAVTRFPGVDVRDLEDVAIGPGGAVHLADIGDNSASRRRVLLHRVPRGGGPEQRQAVSLTYEDGPHDAEALLVHPRTGQVLVITKSVLGAGVYEAGLPRDAPLPADAVLRRVGGVQTSATGTDGGPAIGTVAQLLVTGAAVSPDGRRVAVRTYTDAYLYEVPGEDLVEALRGRPAVVPLPPAPQGEAVTWTPDGTALVVASEGRRTPVFRVPVPPPAGAQAAGPAATTAPPPAATPAPPGAASRPVLPLAAGAAGVLLLAVLAVLAGQVRAARRRARR